MKVTNKTSSPQVVYAIGGRVTIPARGTYEGEFGEGEAKNIAANTAVFDTDATPAARIDPAVARAVVDDLVRVTGERDDARAKLDEIAALFGTPDVDALNVKAAVERLTQDHAALTKATPQAPSDLAAAVAMLDDANDDHWTQAGLPDIATLKSLIGGDVTRAQVDALPKQRERIKPSA